MRNVINPLGTSRRWIALFPVALLTAAVLAVYGRTLPGYFVGDDFGYVSLYYRTPISSWTKLFVEEWSQGIWGFRLPELRPIPALSFLLDAHFWRGHAPGYRTTNLFLHLACSYLVFAVGRKIVRLDVPVAVAAALLFAVHPTHIEAVVWITGRVDLFPTVFCLAGLLAFARFRETGGFYGLALSYGCYFGAVFSKEYGLILPLLIVAYDLCRRENNKTSMIVRRRPWLWGALPYAGYLPILALYYVCRRAAFDSSLAVPVSMGWEHLVRQQIEYWQNLLAFDRLTGGRLFSWKHAASLAQLSWVAVGAFVTMTASALILPRIRPRDHSAVAPLLFCGPIWFLVTTLPFIVTYISARHLYLCSAGYCLFIGALVAGIIGRERRAWFCFMVALLAGTWGFAVWRQTAAWQRTGLMTKKLIEQIRLLADTPPNTVLIMPLPLTPEGAQAFSFSSPFLFGRPFLKPSLRHRVIVFETPGAYYFPARWHQEREFERLNRLTGDMIALKFQFDETSQNWVQRRVDLQRLRQAARGLQDEMQRDPAQDSNRLWEQFVSSL